jgi:hypothetical protein
MAMGALKLGYEGINIKMTACAEIARLIQRDSSGFQAKAFCRHLHLDVHMILHAETGSEPF